MFTLPITYLRHPHIVGRKVYEELSVSKSILVYTLYVVILFACTVFSSALLSQDLGMDNLQAVGAEIKAIIILIAIPLMIFSVAISTLVYYLGLKLVTGSTKLAMKPFFALSFIVSAATMGLILIAYMIIFIAMYLFAMAYANVLIFIVFFVGIVLIGLAIYYEYVQGAVATGVTSGKVALALIVTVLFNGIMNAILKLVAFS